MGIKHEVKGKSIELSLPLVTRDWKALHKDHGITLQSMANPDVPIMSSVAAYVFKKSGVTDIDVDDLTLRELSAVMKIVADTEGGDLDRPT